MLSTSLWSLNKCYACHYPLTGLGMEVLSGPKFRSYAHGHCGGGSEERPSVVFRSLFTSVTEGVKNPDKMGLEHGRFPLPLAVY